MTAFAAPARMQPASEVHPDAPAQNDTAGLKVLLVEDDKFILEELNEIIELEGWEPLATCSVEQALDLLDADDAIRVVVTDVHFTDEQGRAANGIQLVSRARARFPDRGLEYIILSGDPDAVISSEQEGAFKFLSKPLVPDDLVDTVRRAISGADDIAHSETEEAK